MEKYIPKIGEQLYLQCHNGSEYGNLVKTPYTVVAVGKSKIKVQSCDYIWPVYDGHWGREELIGERCQFYDTIPEVILPDPDGEIIELHWAPKKGKWQYDPYKTGYPEIAHFGKYEYYPYLD